MNETGDKNKKHCTLLCYAQYIKERLFVSGPGYFFQCFSLYILNGYCLKVVHMFSSHR